MSNTNAYAHVIPFPGSTHTIVSYDHTAEMQAALAESLPKARIADALAGSSTSCTINELAKLLKQNGVKTGQNRLYARLRSDGYLCTRNSIKNLPTQSAMKRGLFEVRESPYTTWNSTPKTNRTVLVTSKGVSYFARKYIPEISDISSLSGALSVTR